MPDLNRRTRQAFRTLSRRAMLRSAGVSLALPLLNAMAPTAAPAQSGAATPRRLFAICNNLGLLPGEFFPAEAGRNYTPSPYLKILGIIARTSPSCPAFRIRMWMADIRPTSVF